MGGACGFGTRHTRRKIVPARFEPRDNVFLTWGRDRRRARPLTGLSTGSSRYFRSGFCLYALVPLGPDMPVYVWVLFVLTRSVASVAVPDALRRCLCNFSIRSASGTSRNSYAHARNLFRNLAWVRHHAMGLLWPAQSWIEPLTLWRETAPGLSDVDYQPTIG